MQDFLIINIEKLVLGKDLEKTYQAILNYFTVNKLYERSELIIKISSLLISEFSNENKDEMFMLKELVARYIMIVNIFLYLLNIHKENEIYRFMPDLENFEAELKTRAKVFPSDDLYFLNELVAIKQIFSCELAENTEDFELNMLAIKFFKQNSLPYINILNLYINNNNVNGALNFYRENFAPTFNTTERITEPGLYWLLSDKLGYNNRIFESVMYQKKAIDLALKLRGEE